MIETLNKQQIRSHFLAAALWTAGLDDKSIHEFHQSAVTKTDQIIEDFLSKVPEKALKDYFDEYKEEQFGHDLLLSLQGHGAGFFDRTIADGSENILQDICRTMQYKCGIDSCWVDKNTGRIYLE